MVQTVIQIVVQICSTPVHRWAGFGLPRVYRAYTSTLFSTAGFCPGTCDLRRVWASCVGPTADFHLPLAMHSWVASWLFNPSLAHNTAATTSTHVAFVGGRCRRVRDALALP